MDLSYLPRHNQQLELITHESKQKVFMYLADYLQLPTASIKLSILFFFKGIDDF